VSASGVSTIGDLLSAMDRIAPLALAEEWDNVGLIAGDPASSITGPVLITIDLTEAVLAEAEAARAGAIVSYHPPLFQPIKRLVATDARQALILRALAHGMHILSPHTSLDAAPGCMSDWLADALLPEASANASMRGGGGDRRALIAKALSRHTEECKIVTFCPRANVEQLRGAMASAGAGNIGRYQACSFFAEGTGTFLGGPGTHPAVGSAGQMEEAKEVRLEMVLSRRSVPLALELLRRFHPYEEPAIDVYTLEAKPDRSTGAGRRVTLDAPATIHELAERVKRNLGLSHVQIAPTPLRPETHKITRVGLCPGAGASLADAAAREGCDLFLTGEMKHHEVLAANAKGLSIILAGHSNTERGYLPKLAARLSELLPGLTIRHAASDRMLMRTV
jgi:dinuclear metal center YbgI/SA1388 family protein